MRLLSCRLWAVFGYFTQRIADYQPGIDAPEKQERPLIPFTKDGSSPRPDINPDQWYANCRRRWFIDENGDEAVQLGPDMEPNLYFWKAFRRQEKFEADTSWYRVDSIGAWPKIAQHMETLFQKWKMTYLLNDSNVLRALGALPS